MNLMQSVNRPRALVYTSLGQTLRVPLRPGPAPEQQLVGWLNRQMAANPGFPARVKSVLLLVDQQPCPACRAGLRQWLRRWQLTGRLRVVARQEAPPPAGCGCQRALRPAGSAASYPGSLLDELVGELSKSQKDSARDKSRDQSDERVKAAQQPAVAKARKQHKKINPPKIEIHHRVPLQFAHLDPALSKNPNQKNLQALPEPVHAFISQQWRQFHADISKKCIAALSPDLIRQKATEFTQAAKQKFPQVNFTVYGRELELLVQELELEGAF